MCLAAAVESSFISQRFWSGGNRGEVVGVKGIDSATVARRRETEVGSATIAQSMETRGWSQQLQQGVGKHGWTEPPDGQGGGCV